MYALGVEKFLFLQISSQYEYIPLSDNAEYLSTLVIEDIDSLPSILANTPQDGFSISMHLLQDQLNLSLCSKSNDVIKAFLFMTLAENHVLYLIRNVSLLKKYSISFMTSKKVTGICRKGYALSSISLSHGVNYEAPTNYVLDSFKIKIDGITLSNRERQCLNLLLQGYPTRKIAEDLGLSYRTVKHYIENTKHKLNAQYKSRLIKNTEV